VAACVPEAALPAQPGPDWAHARLVRRAADLEQPESGSERSRDRGPDRGGQGPAEVPRPVRGGGRAPVRARPDRSRRAAGLRGRGGTQPHPDDSLPLERCPAGRLPERFREAAYPFPENLCRGAAGCHPAGRVAGPRRENRAAELYRAVADRWRRDPVRGAFGFSGRRGLEVAVRPAAMLRGLRVAESHDRGLRAARRHRNDVGQMDRWPLPGRA
jgi:hypothetical protein